MASPIDVSVFTLANLARLAAAHGPAAFSDFRSKLTTTERTQLRQLERELHDLMAPAAANYQDPVDAAHAAFSKLVYKTETGLSRHDARQVFAKWIEVLGPKLDKKSGVILRYFLARPEQSLYNFARQLAKENEAYPPREQKGWSGTNARHIERLIRDELKRLRELEGSSLKVVDHP